ncbi:aminotransferase family protein [Bacillus thuringiensis]|uniref:aminotransferase family protein n=1 Tax=Bacillus thuringiensis TaxID=1428 RepID=UPI000BF75A33|nr:aspartate aminotransferase family protein [Bacillus thuringiensis]PGR99456.1 aspartate aminotransferase family protein [Bacillus thuringiensis]
MSNLLKSKFATKPLAYDYAEGSWIYGIDGGKYLDASSGAININIGHQCKGVHERIHKQLNRSSYAHLGSLINEESESLATKLCLISDEYFKKVMISTTGTSANELAIALARLYHRSLGGVERTEIISSWTSYHGSSAFTLALSGHRRRRPPLSYSVGTRPTFGYPYKDFHNMSDNEHICSEKCADDIAIDIERIGINEVAAVIIEPILGATGGAMIPPVGFLKRLKENCERQGVLLIYDEVMVGLGRAGLPFAFNNFHEAEPDMCIVSKGLGAGYTTISAVLINEKVSTCLDNSSFPLPLSGTMAGNPLSASIALAVLEELESIGAFEDSLRGEEFGNQLRSLSRFKCVEEIRGIGFFYGLELSNGLLNDFLSVAKKNNLILYPFNGFKREGGNGVLIAPPLNSNSNELNFLINRLDKVLQQFSRME